MADTDQIGIWCTNSDGLGAYTGVAYETQRWECVNGTPYVPASTYKAGAQRGFMSKMLVVLMVLINTVLGQLNVKMRKLGVSF